jgi:hypothetical protein
MPSSLTTDDDYTATMEATVPWRRTAQTAPVESRISAKRRSRHVMQLPTGFVTVVVPAEADEPVWLLPVLEKLADVGSLPENWNSYGARSITAQTVAAALRLLSLIMSDVMPLPSVVPTSRGGIQLEWHTRGVDLEINVSPGGGYTASFEDLRGSQWSGDVTSDLSPLRAVLVTLAAT